MIDLSDNIIRSKEVGEYLYNHELFEMVVKEESYNKLKISKSSKKTYNGIVEIERSKSFGSNSYEYKLKIKHQHLYNYETSGVSHNASLFTSQNAIDSINMFQSLFNLSDYDLSYIRITQIELNTKIYVQNAIEFIHSVFGVGLKKFNETDNDFLCKSLKLQNIWYKLYHKGKQYPELCDPNTVVLERKIKRNQEIIKHLECENLLDLKDASKYIKIAEQLNKTASELLILNYNADTNNLSEVEKRKFEKYINPLFWINDVKEEIKKGKNKKGEGKNKNYYQQTLDSYNTLQDKIKDNIHNRFIKLVLESVTNQLSSNLKNVEKYTVNVDVKFHKTDSRDNENNKSIKKINISSNPSNPSNPSNINLIGGGVVGSDSDSVNACSESNLINCTVTGVSLKLERENNQNAIYIQTKTLKYLFENNPNEYQKIKHAFIKNSIHEPKFEKNEFSHIAKQIRNAYYNKFRYIARAGVNQIPLF